MLYDLVEDDERMKYKGIERSFSTVLYYRKNKSAKIDFNFLLNCEFKAYDLIYDSPQTKEIFIKLCMLMKKMKEKKVKCDVIVYDKKPLKDAFGYELEFLGVDIEADKTECPLESHDGDGCEPFINNNGLCPDISSAMILSKRWLSVFSSFDYIYVYKVVF